MILLTGPISITLFGHRPKNPTKKQFEWFVDQNWKFVYVYAKLQNELGNVLQDLKFNGS